MTKSVLFEAKRRSVGGEFGGMLDKYAASSRHIENP
jgi:hypothetical protein